MLTIHCHLCASSNSCRLLRNQTHYCSNAPQKFYMDNFFHSFNTTHEARDSTTQLKSSLRQGRFNLTKFVSNTNEAIYSIDGGEVATNATLHRVVGVKWNTTDDMIFVQPTTKLTNTTSSTLRTVLSTVARVFDPLGILAPLVIKLKILLQNLWKSGISWDETMPSDFVPMIDKWVGQCKQVSSVRLPHLLGPQLSPSDIQLHVFCDASQDAMATCIYFRTACSSGIYATFLIGRTKVTPLNQESIPKLELQAAVLGARLCNFATDEMRLKPHSTHF